VRLVGAADVLAGGRELASAGRGAVGAALPHAFGIIVPFSKDVSVVNDRLANLHEGVTYSSGGTGPYRDNLTSEVATPFNGTGTDAGNNH